MDWSFMIVAAPLAILIIFGWNIWYWNHEECPYCGSHRNDYLGGAGHCKSKYRCKKCGKEFIKRHAHYD